MDLNAALILTFFILVAEHYFPFERVWRQLFRQEMHVTFKYALGVLGISAPFVAWIYQLGYLDVIHGYWKFVVTGGAGVVLAYILDHWMLRNDQLSEKTEELELVKEQRDAAQERP